MFGMGLTELILIAVVGIIALGPEKLPDAMIKIAKMFNKLKELLSDAKDTIDEQVQLDEITKDMKKYQQTIKDTSDEIMRTSGANKAKEEMGNLNKMLGNDYDEDYDNNYDENGNIVKEKKKKKKKKKKAKKKEEDLLKDKEETLSQNNQEKDINNV
jgi:sec-independent protein translocase protein TatB